MHLLSARNRSEFLAVPQLVRFTLAQGKDGSEAVLLIKSSTLTLKYLLRLKRFCLVVLRIGAKWLVYGIQIDDDPEHPVVLWSLLEYDDEVDAMRALMAHPKCVLFLFNELVANVAWGEVDIDLSDEPLRALIESATLHPTDDMDALGEVSQRIEALHRGELTPTDGHVLILPDVRAWHPITSHYITNRASRSLISIFETDEGAQQEEIALWLTDNLQPTGAVKNPQVHELNKVRELSDLLLSHEYGTFLIESKTLSVLAREALPNRAKLSRDVIKRLRKATSQLVGGVKNLRRGLRITDAEGREVEVERTKPPHVIVLVPDLTLLSEATEFGGDFIRESSKKSGGVFHILDPKELLRIVQAAEMISARGETTTPIMAFDFYLMERFKRAVTSNTPNFGVLIRFED